MSNAFVPSNFTIPAPGAVNLTSAKSGSSDPSAASSTDKFTDWQAQSGIRQYKAEPTISMGQLAILSDSPSNGSAIDETEIPLRTMPIHWLNKQETSYFFSESSSVAAATPSPHTTLFTESDFKLHQPLPLPLQPTTPVTTNPAVAGNKFFNSISALKTAPTRVVGAIISAVWSAKKYLNYLVYLASPTSINQKTLVRRYQASKIDKQMVNINMQLLANGNNNLITMSELMNKKYLSYFLWVIILSSFFLTGIVMAVMAHMLLLG